MTKIGLLSDTHGYIDQTMLNSLSDCDEIWHAGDWGVDVAEQLMATRKPIRGVYGNIDGRSIRNQFMEINQFEIEQLRVYMIHIGGYPPKYVPGIREQLISNQIGLLICGHSHILKIMPDKSIPNLLHINPGAAGKSGFHVMRTMVKFNIAAGRVWTPEVVELGYRNKI
ncbi:MAG: metallophosphoesterase family protein [Bacteroidota bacterium]|jgi:putative phosphoesterase